MIHLDTGLSVMGSKYQMSNLGSTVSDKEQEYIKAAMHKRFPTWCTNAQALPNLVHFGRLPDAGRTTRQQH